MLIYLSGPYTGNVDDNIAQARVVAIRLWEIGHAVICPHTNTARFEDDGHATYEQYLAGDFNMVARCDALVMMPNWLESKGACAEADYAKSLSIPIYIAPNLPPLHPTEVRCPAQAQAFRELCGQMYRTHLSKNSDYSPANILATGEIGLVTRLWDKIARLLNLHGFRFTISEPGVLTSGREPQHESINDTYMDAAVYALIGLLLRRGVWGR